jgi:Flp pilus assembly protein TadD
MPVALENLSGASPPTLIPFPFSEEAQQDVRSLALAWRSLADTGLQSARPKAEKLLRRAVVTFPQDPAILSALAYIEQQRGNKDQARELYERALAADPDSVDAATNLGVLEARRGHVGKAVKLWQSAFERAPGRSSIGMNLVRAFCQTSQFDEARSYDLRVLKFNPDLPDAKTFLQKLNRVPPKCEP